MTLEQRLNIAKSLRSQGYNCAQCVYASFTDISGLSEQQALTIATGLGGGVGGCGQVCGVVSAMAMLEGSRTQGLPADKREVYGAVSELYRAFAQKFGSCICHQLKADKVPCIDLIYMGIEMYHQHLEQQR